MKGQVLVLCRGEEIFSEGRRGKGQMNDGGRRLSAQGQDMSSVYSHSFDTPYDKSSRNDNQKDLRV